MTYAQKAIKIILIGFIVALAFVIFEKLASTSLSNSEVASCYELLQESQDYREFFLTQWQDEMCKAHGIEITAPVR